MNECPYRRRKDKITEIIKEFFMGTILRVQTKERRK